MLSFKVPWAANCIIGIYCVFLDVRFPKIPGCDFRRISELPGNLPISSPGLSAFLNFSGPRIKKEESRSVLGKALGEERLVSCVVFSLIPKLSHIGQGEAGVAGMASYDQEWNMCFCENANSCSVKSGKAPLGSDESGHTGVPSQLRCIVETSLLLQ